MTQQNQNDARQNERFNMSGFGAIRLTPQAKTKVYSSSDVLSDEEKLLRGYTLILRLAVIPIGCMIIGQRIGGYLFARYFGSLPTLIWSKA